MSLVTVVLTVLLSSFCLPALAQVAVSSRPIEVHWSEKKTFLSPGRKWAIDVVPTANDGPANAYLRNTAQGKTRRLFQVSRDSLVHWKQDTSIVVEDMESSSQYRLMLFDPLDAYLSQKRGLAIDDLIRSSVKDQLKPTEEINYYFPRFVAWADREFVASTGVVTVNGNSGSFIPHCFGWVLDVRPLKIKARLSEGELKERYGAACQLWPL